MKKLMLPSVVILMLLLTGTPLFAQETGRILSGKKDHRGCLTMLAMEEAIRLDPSLPEKWRVEGERQRNAFNSQTKANSILRTQAGEVIIPIVFHLVDTAGSLNKVSDRDIYEQVEILNTAFSGKKIERYKDLIPADMAARVGQTPIRFVLARRDPAGNLSSGIERRVALTPSRTNIKSTAAGGLDAWDTNKYLNVWAGTFSGADEGLLGIATFPFTSSEGPQGTVVGLFTLGANSCRSYYTTYAEGATLAHELGHYFYLYHTFGDQGVCNNADFRTQSGWALTGASLTDDTPMEKGAGGIIYGNPSMNYNDGCAPGALGMMYGSFMNYFDDRALFMFSQGHKERIMETINVYRPGFLTSNGATAPVPVNDAFLVSFTPGGGCDQRQPILNNIPVKAKVRNLGTSPLLSVNLALTIDGGATSNTLFPLMLAPGADTVLVLAPMNLSAGNHTISVSTSLPNAGIDAFPSNDMLVQYVNTIYTTVNAPLVETFTGAMPTASGWTLWNPHGNTANTWGYNATSGNLGAGSAFFRNYNINQPGTLDDLITPAINLGTGDSAALSFYVAHAVYDATDVSSWDGLEVYISDNGGESYKMVYKKSGNQLRTTTTVFPSTGFTATPAQADRWRKETINLTPFMASGKPVLIKFRNVNAYGNNTIIDDISISPVTTPNLDIQPVEVLNLKPYACDVTTVTPSIKVQNNGLSAITSFRVNYILDNGTVNSTVWNGNLAGNSSVTVSFPAINVTQGNHALTMFTSQPNGFPDQQASNDTMRRSFTIFPKVQAPLKESFEGNVFPPAGWAIGNPDNSTTWARTQLGYKPVAATDGASAWMNNFSYNGSDRRDELITPKIRFADADSVYLSFDLSAASFTHALLPTDTLEVLVTTDCGQSFYSVYKKFGPELQTVRHPSTPVTYNFVAGYYDHVWRNETINLQPILGSSNEFQVMFKSTHNSQGNNIYLDNVNVFTKNVPQNLKDNGHVILANPFTNMFRIWHYEQPTGLRYVNVYDATGRLIWTRSYNGNAEKVIGVDLSGKPAGVYLVKLGYDKEDRNLFERVIKR